jgi:hypothetical protein
MRMRSKPPGWLYSGLTLDQADAKPIFIWADGRRGADHAASFKADQTIGGYEAQWLTDGPSGTGLVEPWMPGRRSCPTERATKVPSWTPRPKS